MPVIDITNLTFAYPTADKIALDNISLQIRRGEFVGIIGPNNAGKSSLFFALTSVIPHLFQGQMAGHVRILDKETTETSVSETASSIAFVMQNPESQLSGVCFTVREEVAFILENQGVARDEMLRRVENALSITGITDLADRSPSHLSGGQLQKVVLASALVCDAPILVLDEPTTFLDPMGIRQLYDILRQLKDAGKTIVLADQRLEYIAQYTDRIIALHQGKKVLDGPSKEMLISPVLQEIGLGWTRFTQVADLAKSNGLWSEETALGTTLTDTVSGLKRRH